MTRWVDDSPKGKRRSKGRHSCAEGPTVLTHILDADPAALRIGLPVKVVLQAAKDGQYFPAFTPS